MAGKFSSSAIISYFGGDDSDHLAEVVFEGSEDELGMEDEDDVKTIDSSSSSFSNEIDKYAHAYRFLSMILD